MGLFSNAAQGILKWSYGAFDDTINNAVSAITGGEVSVTVDGEQAAEGGGVIHRAVSKSAGTFTFDDFDANWSRITEMSQAVITPVCTSILAICVLIELINVLLKMNTIKWEDGLKVMIKMVLAKVCMDAAPYFMWAIYKQCVSWIGSVWNYLGTGTGSNLQGEMAEALDTAMDTVGKLGMGWSILLILLGVIVYVAIKAVGMMVIVIAYARIIEILVYAAISPIPCAFFPLGDGPAGISRITMNFFKNYIAVCLQGLLMVIVLAVFNMISETFVAGLSDEYMLATTDSAELSKALVGQSFEMLLLVVVLLVVVMRCGNWARSIMDAH